MNLRNLYQILKGRDCPICERRINFNSFILYNDFTKMNYSSMWDNPILAIPCCSCFKLMEKLEGSVVIVREYRHKISIFKDNTKCDYHIHDIEDLKVIIKNLKKFGVIEE